MLEIRRYKPTMADEWNQFVATSKNGTFLFDRRYMDYHSDRFPDHSLVFYRKGRLYALLPATLQPTGLISHAGLTYGGLITDHRATAADVCELFILLNDYLRQEGIGHVVYRPTPHIYHRLPAEEDLYALTQVCHARLTARDISSAIIREPRLPFTESRRSGLRKATAAGMIVGESSDYEGFWKILTDNLLQRHRTRPVHSIEEILLLKSRFPDNIRLFTAELNGKTVGGTVVYETSQVVHTQYIAASEEGKRLGALDLLFDHLVHNVHADAACIDFGKSTAGDSCDLNSRLIFQKEGFGARAVCYDTYEWDIPIDTSTREK